MKVQEIKPLLPVVFQRSLSPKSPLMALLEVMESLHAPVESVLIDLDRFFDPRRTPEAFVPYLARWLDLERLFDRSALATETAPAADPLSTGVAPLRELIAIAAYLSRWRGTAKGLVLFLETALDTRGFEVSDRVMDASGQLRPFHIEIKAPAITRSHQALIQRIIEAEKPAYVTYELTFT